jgi:hypothetical protein
MKIYIKKENKKEKRKPARRCWNVEDTLVVFSNLLNFLGAVNLVSWGLWVVDHFIGVFDKNRCQGAFIEEAQQGLRFTCIYHSYVPY